MTALATNYEAARKDGEIITYPVAGSTHIYSGALVGENGSGYAIPATDGSTAFLGVAVEEADNSGSATAGAKEVRVYKTGTFSVAKASATQTDLALEMLIHDDNTVGASSTSSLKAGTVVDIVDSSHVRIRIDNYTK
jgi:hypothetical protein